MDWIENPWVVGIGGGILSGLAVTLLSRIILSRKDRGEYAQKLQSANREVIYALRPGISEGLVPERRVVESLINATSRKYAVDKDDLHSPDEIREELTKEIMDSSFISAKTKQEYYNQLIPLAEAPAKLNNDPIYQEQDILESKSSLAEYRARMTSMMSVLLGAVTAITTMALALSRGSTFGGYESIASVFLPAVVALSTTLVMVLLMIYKREYARSSRKALEGDSDSGGSSKSTPSSLRAHDLMNDVKSARSNRTMD